MGPSEQDHFDNISDRYQRAADSWKVIYEEMATRINPMVATKVVLDVGNGGRFAYDTNLPSQVIAMDIASTMMDNIKNSKIIKVVGDARDMSPIEDSSVDIIIFLLVLHHINGPSREQSLQTLDQVLSAAFSKLRPGGYLMVTEPLLSPMLFKLQCLLFPLTRFILGRFTVSMIFFFSKALLTKRIAQVFELRHEEIEVLSFRLKGWIDPLGGSFPGVLKIPASVQPWNFCLMIAPKRRN